MATNDAIRTIRERLRGYTDRALARLGLTATAVDATRTAHFLAHYSADGDIGDVLEQAAQLRAEANRILEQAVVAARGEGRTWDRIGEAIGVSRQAAQERFKSAETAWRDALIEPVVPDGRQLTTMKEPLSDLADPAQAAALVDQHLRRLAPAMTNGPVDERPIAERLPRPDPITRVQEITWRATEITRRRGVDGEVAADMVEDYQARKAAAVDGADHDTGA